MKVIVCGAGQVGFNIARYLASENADVTVIDISPELVQRITDSLDVSGLVGFASHPEVLERAGAADADMVVAVTYADEVNMVACQVCHSMFEVPTKIARVRHQSYLDPVWSDLFSHDNMPIDVIISPEIEVARAISRRLSIPGAFDAIGLADGRISLIGVHVRDDTPIINTPAAPAHRPVSRPEPLHRRHRAGRQGHGRPRRQRAAAGRRRLLRLRHGASDPGAADLRPRRASGAARRDSRRRQHRAQSGADHGARAAGGGSSGWSR